MKPIRILICPILTACMAEGKGRTGVMMYLYDMMVNPDLSAREITERQEIIR